MYPVDPVFFRLKLVVTLDIGPFAVAGSVQNQPPLNKKTEKKRFFLIPASKGEKDVFIYKSLSIPLFSDLLLHNSAI